MDSKIVIRGVIAIIFATLLVFLLVYLTNADQLRRRRTPASTDNSAMGEVTLENSEVQTVYGIQIGNNLKAFLADENFFDTAGTSTSDYSEETVVTLAPHVTVERGTVIIRVTDTDGQLITGESFSVSLTKTGELTGRTTEVVYTDDDRDGVIEARDLSDGVWKVSMHAMTGYHMPAEDVSITIGDGSGSTGSSTGGSANSAGSNTSRTDEDEDEDADDTQEEEEDDDGADTD